MHTNEPTLQVGDRLPLHKYEGQGLTLAQLTLRYYHASYVEVSQENLMELEQLTMAIEEQLKEQPDPAEKLEAEKLSHDVLRLAVESLSAMAERARTELALDDRLRKLLAALTKDPRQFPKAAKIGTVSTDIAQLAVHGDDDMVVIRTGADGGYDVYADNYDEYGIPGRIIIDLMGDMGADYDFSPPSNHQKSDTPTNILEVLEAYPALTLEGFSRVRPDHTAETIASLREELIAAEDQVSACREWIRNNCEQRKTINLHVGSYGLKHRIERATSVDGEHLYIGNGSAIAAFALEGYRLKREGINCCFNVKLLKHATP